MSDNPVPSSTLDQSPTPLVTPQPKVTPAPIAIALVSPSSAAVAPTPQSTAAMPAPAPAPAPAAMATREKDTPKETPGAKTGGGVPNPWANHKPNDPLPTGVMPRPSLAVRGAPSPSTPIVASAADATAAPVIASAVPKMEAEHTGPITKKQRAFFASSPKVEISGLKNAPPLVPLPKRPTNVRPSEQVEMSGGVLVIERTSSAWIATAAVALAGIAIAGVLYLDASMANDTVRAREGEIVELTKKVADLEALKRAPVAPAAVVASVAEAGDVDVSAVVDAVRAKLAREVTRDEARISVDGARVTIALEGVLDKKGKLSKRSADVLARAGSALATSADRIERVDVVAYSDGNAGRGKSEWGQSAGRATNAARALGLGLGLGSALDAKKVAVVGKGKGPSKRIELVVTAK